MQDFTGGCLCGAVRYRLTGPLPGVIACHCSQCRRQSGHYGAYTTVPLDRFQSERDAALTWYRSSDWAQRGFCRVCGSVLFWKRTGEESINVSAGTLDEPTGLTIVEHIFCKDKGDYYDLSDGKPQKDGW